MAADAGRQNIPITILAFGDPTMGTLELYRNLDVERVVLGLERPGMDDAASTLPLLDHYEPVIAALA